MRTGFTSGINRSRSGYFIAFQSSIQKTNRIHDVVLEVLTAVATNSSIFWDITP
jgi:hypothetical protein